MNGPIFLLASERSGTNLLRRRLTEFQSTVVGPAAGQFLKHLYRAAPFYGSLSDDAAFLELITDALDLSRVHFSPWMLEVSPQEVLESYSLEYGKERQVILLIHHLHMLFARSRGFDRYFCKDNSLFDFAPQLLLTFSDAGFIYLHRDPRDCALSQLKRTFMSSSLVRIASLWRDEQIECLTLLQQSPIRQRIYRLSYEELLEDEAGKLDEICEFFALERRQRPLRTHFDSGTTEEWENLDGPTLRDNRKKFEREMTARQIDVVESIVWKQMTALGYRPVNDERPSLRPLYRSFDLWYHRVIDAVRLRWLARRPEFRFRRERSELLRRIAQRKL